MLGHGQLDMASQDEAAIAQDNITLKADLKHSAETAEDPLSRPSRRT